ncbi:hypothetical protein Rsub_07858 [Raphidocelis subcapitata]|uniref:UNC-50 family protein n=1 Tax=Raphidocelis subcapitata TaxID=307507 RepID=A0A2V0P6M4_9CHLO|nr:hypothetical protein Rsub_07858 [Raphidocelis subcapitata]|eukprot:GBF95508.1 hypothetical protein Rsub_07858 [Raphidocelis subcapitata]
MLPTSAAAPPSGLTRRGSRSGSMFGTYFRRIIKPQQMDFEYTFWLMLQLCISPKTAYRHTSYQKQTKNLWARDDPAFVVVCCLLLAAASAAYCATFSRSLWHSMLSVLSAVVVDFLLIGLATSSTCWFIANRFLRKRNLPHHQVEQHVEWLYAFDVHCNSWFPLFLELYVLQFLLTPLLLLHAWLPSALACVLYAAAFSHYHYLNFLGYSALPFLERTEALLWPVGAIVIALPFALLLRFNPSRFVLSMYFS